jgi:hypothetical protein
MYEEMFNILSNKGNANENITDTLSHCSQNGYHQENAQPVLLTMQGESIDVYAN